MGEEISREEGGCSLIPSSTMLRLHSAEGCVDVVVSVFSGDINEHGVRVVGCFGTVELEHAGAICSFVGGDAQLLLVATTRDA